MGEGEWVRERLAPYVIVLAGPNGAGKSTTAPALLRDVLGITELVNADLIAQGLSAFGPERMALAAGRIMLARLQDLARRRASFAFETTLAGRSLRPWLAKLDQKGYRIHVVFLWLSSEDLAVERVAERVRTGGHDVPKVTIRRRYRAGLRNFFALYQSLAITWEVYDNSRATGPRLVARGEGARVTLVSDSQTWTTIKRGVRNAGYEGTRYRKHSR